MIRCSHFTISRLPVAGSRLLANLYPAGRMTEWLNSFAEKQVLRANANPGRYRPQSRANPRFSLCAIPQSLCGNRANSVSIQQNAADPNLT